MHGERTVWSSDWVSVALADVEIPGSRRFDHHVVRVPTSAAGCVVVDPDRGVLLLWRHRFIPDVWGYEVPAGRLEPGEPPAEAAAREVREETGWVPGPVRPLLDYHPIAGLSDHLFHLFSAAGATYEGPPTDAFESERVEWVSVADVRRAVRSGQVHDGLSLTALLAAEALGVLGPPEPA